MTIKKTTAPSRSTVSTKVAVAARPATQTAAPTTTRRAERPDDPRAAERLADVASRTAAQLGQLDEFARSRVGLEKLDGRGAAGPLDAFGDQQTKGSNRSSPLDRLRDGFSRDSGAAAPPAGLEGSFLGGGDPLDGLGKKQSDLDPFAELGKAVGPGSQSESFGGEAGLERLRSSIGQQFMTDSVGDKAAAVVNAAGKTGAVVAAVAGGVAAAPVVGAVAAAGGVAAVGAVAGNAIDEAITKVAGESLGGMVAKIQQATPTLHDFLNDSPAPIKLNSEFTFSKAEAAAALGGLDALKGQKGHTFGLSRPTGDGSTGGSGGSDDAGTGRSGGGLPAGGLAGDGAEMSGGAPTAASQAPARPQLSWDPVDGTTDHQVGVGTFLAGRKFGGGLASDGATVGGGATVTGGAGAGVHPTIRVGGGGRSDGGREF